MMRWLLFFLAFLGLTAGAQEAVPLAEKGKGYHIQARYPKLPVAEAWAKKQVADFKKDFQDSTGGKPDRVPWSLDLNYTVPFKSSKVLVVYFAGSTYSGGAHPNPFLATLVIDQQTGQALQLADMFSGAYLEEFSKYARAELAKRDLSSEADWIARGTEPKAENFSVSYPTQNGFMLVFPPYQVAPYVSGPQEVLVPWSALAPYRGSHNVLD